jgi:hypothetical protein
VWELFVVTISGTHICEMLESYLGNVGTICKNNLLELYLENISWKYMWEIYALHVETIDYQQCRSTMTMGNWNVYRSKCRNTRPMLDETHYKYTPYTQKKCHNEC